jgi:AraC family transcriptional regulator of adaptative response / DNA-3-methyladenine glycosylase II
MRGVAEARPAPWSLLPARPPFDGSGVLRFLAARAIPGVEEVVDGTYRRVLVPAAGADPLVVAARPTAEGVEVTLGDATSPDASAARAIVGRLFGLDVDPSARHAALRDDPTLGPLLAEAPGLRVPGAASGFEVAVRAILGQQISVAAARTLAGRLVAALGAPLPTADGGLTHALFTPAALAAAPDALFTMPRMRAGALRALAAADPRLSTPADAAALTALPGVGPWTAGYVALRLGDPDVFLPADVVLRHALRAHDLAASDTERWRPWRSTAVLLLWRDQAARRG